MDNANNSQNLSKDLDYLFLTDENLREFVEALFFAYKNFTNDPDEILREVNMGRAHHRVIHFVNRAPGLQVSELLAILSVTKQSLNRVMRLLVAEGYINVQTSEIDRRARELYLTEKGRALDKRLREAQHKRLKKALLASKPEDVSGFRNVLNKLIDADSHKLLEKIRANTNG